jgi:hypothetical protein
MRAFGSLSGALGSLHLNKGPLLHLQHVPGPFRSFSPLKQRLKERMPSLSSHSFYPNPSIKIGATQGVGKTARLGRPLSRRQHNELRRIEGNAPYRYKRLMFSQMDRWAPALSAGILAGVGFTDVVNRDVQVRFVYPMCADGRLKRAVQPFLTPK